MFWVSQVSGTGKWNIKPALVAIQAYGIFTKKDYHDLGPIKKV